MAGRTETRRITIQLPAGFDQTKHQRALEQLIAKQYGSGFEIDNINTENNTATATQHNVTTEVSQSTEDSFQLRLSRGLSKPSEGEKAAAKFEDQHPGYYMTKFEPFLGKATLSKLTEDEARCRGAIAVALGAKPWDVEVRSRADGGFDLDLPRTYQPSKAEKIEEVASEVVGRPGWYAVIDAQRLTASLIPADPPTFPATIEAPLSRLGAGDVMATPFGHVLARPGGKDGVEAVIDWRASGSALICGLAGGGKTVAITAILADRVANGASLAVIDTADKAVDFLAFKNLCAVSSLSGRTIPTWGCDTLGAAVAVLAMLCEEGKARAKYLAEEGINNWLDLPDGKQFNPIFIIADEFEALVARDPVPKALPKDHPMRVEVEQDNMAHDLIAHYMNRIVKEFRFVGLHPLISTQVSNASTGLPPSLKGKMGHFVLCGSTPSEAARRQAFPDEKSVPGVPGHIASGGSVARGTGSAKIEGGGAFVFKSFFAPVSAYARALADLGVPQHSDHEVVPTQSMIDQYLPSLEDEDDSPDGGRGGRGERAPSGRLASEVAREMGDDLSWMQGEDGERLTGFEKANAARAAVVAGAKKSVGSPSSGDTDGGDDW